MVVVVMMMEEAVSWIALDDENLELLALAATSS